MKIGIIQTRGIGDIIIACPIAMHYVQQGHTVYWPIDIRDHASFSQAFPEIYFIPVNITTYEQNGYDYLIGFPERCLRELGCDKILTLYSEVARVGANGEVTNLLDPKYDSLKKGMKFDAYKYGVAEVPFREKWNFMPQRNLEREHSLLEQIRGGSTRPFILCHTKGSRFQCDIPMPSDIREHFDVIRIEPITDNVFDWITALSAAAHVFTIDSCFGNLVEQMDLNPNKTFIFWNSRVEMTPTLINHWHFM